MSFTFAIFLTNKYSPLAPIGTSNRDKLFSFCRKKDKKGKKKKLVEVSKIIEEEKPQKTEITRTKAELAFQKMQEKMVSTYSIC